MNTQPFDLTTFIRNVFDPEEGERIVLMTDTPTETIPDHQAWQDRRAMASEWLKAFRSMGDTIGFSTDSYAFPATGANNADLPTDSGLAQHLQTATLIVAMTEFSATAPLVRAANARGGAAHLRVASMPRVEPRMQQTGLAADYSLVAKRCRILREALQDARSMSWRFSTEDTVRFDLRFRESHMDDGYLHRDKQFRDPGTHPLINLPAGETYVVPYEGEYDGVPSETEGVIPVVKDGDLAFFIVEGNRIVKVVGKGPAADFYRELFAADPARANIAEGAYGCNDNAVVTGNVLEDEKAGPHFAFGRSEHLGGIWGPDRFLSPQTVIHQDIVYAKDSPIQVTSAIIEKTDGTQVTVIDKGNYVLW